ncbi:unnamed protein product [Staurois parvus]|uniref:Uncharacterized protein n=1 Tax=Staurois parvus TaxID=386267 RepID=A0ABN9E534_9NEOB|nr:unnamed protein product [Staurois parvus]
MKSTMPDMAERILDLTLEIIYLLTGEDYVIVRKSRDDPTSKLLSKSKSLISFLPPPSLIPDRNSDKKILEVTKKIIDLLMGEVPIRCQDVTVYFSMEEWEYLEGHKDLYKDVMMDNQPPLTSPGHRLLPQNIYPRLQGTYRSLHSSSAEKPSKDTSDPVRHTKQHKAGKDNSCSECGKCFTENSSQHAEEKRYQCLECGKRFFFKSDLTVHQRVHTGEEPYPCFECGKSFSHRTTLVCHQRMHRGEKPFLCSDCGKCFTRKSCLLQHERIHTGVKPYVCSECGKSFNQKSSLISHQRGHRGEKPFTCSVCGKSFTRSSSLVVHHRFHTGERPPTPA